MKTFILSFTFLLASTICFAQQPEKKFFIDGKDLNETTYEYIEITAYTQTHGKKYRIDIDVGGEYVNNNKNVFTNETGNLIQFGTPMDAVNYISKCGWELYHSSVSVTQAQQLLHYIMRKKKNFGENSIK